MATVLSIIVVMKEEKSGGGLNSMCQPIQVSRWGDRLVGVIDLQGGLAVHGVAGNRDRYMPVKFCEGDPERLGRYYLEQGVTSLYIADLDGLGGGKFQIEACGRLLQLGFHRIWIDIGWQSQDDGVTREMGKWSQTDPAVCWIVATETGQRANELDSLLSQVSAAQICVSLDFSNGQFRGKHHDWRGWIAESVQRSINQFLVLDVASVGIGCGVSTLSLCRQMKSEWPQIALSSGGGVRGETDVQDVIEAGCDSVLVATALFPNISC